MIATHTQKINGVLYRAGEVLPSPDEKPVVKAVNESANVIVNEKPKYNKKDITFMKLAQLREVASEYGVENPDEKTGVELKQILIEKMGL